MLDTTTKSLEIILSGAVAATELDFTCSWVDLLASTMDATDAGETDGTTNGATAVTVLSAVVSGHRKKCVLLTVTQNDSAAVTFTLRLNNNMTYRKIWSGTLNPGDTFQYAE